MRFKDKVILVTGSSRGIGRAIALAFAQEGGTVAVHGSQESAQLDETLHEIMIHSPDSIKMACELSDSAAIRAMFAVIERQFGRLDILVNNAATQNPAPFLELAEDDWDRVLAVNLKAPFLCGQLAARIMQRQGKGKIINIGSVHEFQPRRNYAHYSAAKGGLLMLTKSMALELAAYNIQVNQITAGAIATSLTDPERQRKLLSAIPAGRIAQPSEVASLACFLASEQADYITGESFIVDGGLTLGFCASRPDL